MREQRALLLVLGLAAAASGSVRTDCPDEAGDDYTSVRAYALQLQQKGATEEAIACFHVAAGLDQARPEPWLSIGEIYRTAGHYTEAITALRRCCDIAGSGGRPVMGDERARVRDAVVIVILCRAQLPHRKDKVLASAPSAAAAAGRGAVLAPHGGTRSRSASVARLDFRCFRLHCCLGRRGFHAAGARRPGLPRVEAPAAEATSPCGRGNSAAGVQQAGSRRMALTRIFCRAGR